MVKHNKNQSRRALREEALHSALDVRLPERVDVCVVGGGASGLMAAYTAAEAGAKVAIIDAAPLAGATLLRTGNGRCNFAASDLYEVMDLPDGHVGAYHNAEFVKKAAGTAPLDHILTRFSSLGLAWTAEDTRLYPASLCAESVRAVLAEGCARVGARYCGARQITKLTKGEDGFDVCYRELGQEQREGSVHSDKLILACGGRALDEENESNLFMALLRLGLPLVGAEPMLCPLACNDVPQELDGRRVRARVRLWHAAKVCAQEDGEVLFRTTGLSGIVIFNLSRLALPGDEISLDLVPDIAVPPLRQRLRSLCNAGVSLRTAAYGLTDPEVADVLLARSLDWNDLVLSLKELRFEIASKMQRENAQVMRGGISVESVDPSTMQIKRTPGLFACGEVLDVDAPCGGYNLAWAWISGALAGSNAARSK